MAGTINDLLSVIDRLIFQQDIQQNNPLGVVVKFDDLFPTSLTKAEAIRILQRIEHADGITFLSIDKDFGRTGPFESVFLNREKDQLSINIHVNADALVRLKKELNEQHPQTPSCSLKGAQIDLDEAKCLLIVDTWQVQFPPDRIEFRLCRFMMNQRVGDVTSWDVVYEAIEGKEPDNDKRTRKKIYDATNRVNTRIKEALNCKENFLIMQGKTLRRQY